MAAANGRYLNSTHNSEVIFIDWWLIPFHLTELAASRNQLLFLFLVTHLFLI